MLDGLVSNIFGSNFLLLAGHVPNEIYIDQVKNKKIRWTRTWNYHGDFVVSMFLQVLLFIFSSPSFIRPASWLRVGRGVPDRSRRLAWRPPSDPASSPGTPSSPPGEKRYSAASLRPALPPPGRVGCGRAASAARGCPLWMVPLPPAVSRTLPAFQPLRW